MVFAPHRKEADNVIVKSQKKLNINLKMNDICRYINTFKVLIAMQIIILSLRHFNEKLLGYAYCGGREIWEDCHECLRRRKLLPWQTIRIVAGILYIKFDVSRLLEFRGCHPKRPQKSTAILGLFDSMTNLGKPGSFKDIM